MTYIKLFCFPYAGGSATIYNKWGTYLNATSNIELVPVELASRGRRINEPFYTDLDNAVEDLYEIITSKISHAPYAFFGHSLGALLIYELAQKIKQIDQPQPLHLFFSGRGAPNVKSPMEKTYHLMDEDQFKHEIIDLGGTPPELFEHAELLDLFLPLLRNDFKLAETNLTERKVNPFDCNITVFSGKEDYKISVDQIDSWKMHTSGVCSLHYFNGGHFFLHNKVPFISRIIIDTLKNSH